MKHPEFAFGQEVEVVHGLSTGRRGVIEELTRIPFGSIPTYSVRFPDIGLRVLRADYLRRVPE